MVKDFFEYLSFRQHSENDLSEVTWAMCHASTVFREAFLNFFFPDILFSDDVKIEREVSKDDSRPDFIITNNDTIYIIENKIWDQNHHFEQYETTFNVSPDKFGYIANYIIPQPNPLKVYQIRTWADFYKMMESIEVKDKMEESLIEGYRNYLKNVCSILDFTKPMNIEGAYNLYQLMEILIKLCEREEDNYILNVYNKDRTYNNQFANHKNMGVNFELKIKNIDFKVWGWIGLYFEKENPTIHISFLNKNNWGKLVCDLIRKESIVYKGIYSSDPYEEDGAYWFDFIGEKGTFRESFNQLSLDGQTEQLKSFMDEVINYISLLKNDGKH